MLYPFSYKQFHGILVLAMLMLRNFVHLFIYPSIHVSPCLTFHPSIHKLAYHNQENAAIFISEKKIDVLIDHIWFIPSIPPITNCLIIIRKMLPCLFQKKKFDVPIYQIWFIPSIPPITNCLIIIREMLPCLFQKKKLS